MSTDFRPIEIPPGVVSKPTKQARSSNWAETNLVRWVEGRMGPVGGQTQFTYSFASRCRAVHGWYGLDSIWRVAYLCEANLYVDIAQTLYDITPVGGMTVPTLPTTGGYSDGLYNVGLYGAPRTGAGAISPAPIEQLPDVFSLSNFGQVLLAMTSSDSRLLQWTPSSGTPGAAILLNATASFNTASPTITMTANPGTVLPGMSVYDTTNNQQIGIVLTFPNGGTTLTLTANALHSSSGAADHLSFSSQASIVAGAPHGRCFVVTQERFVQIFGQVGDGTADGGSFRRFGWCDQENPYSWNFSDVTSQAGFLDIEPASPIVCAVSTRTGTLFWTGKKAYVSKFLGMPYIYNYTELADNCTPWSPQSKVTTSSMVLWMSEQGAFSFDGTSILPINCLVRPWVDGDVDDVNVRWQSCAVHVENYNEFWWFFPQDNQPYNTRAIVYNYKEGWWSMARMSRSAGVTASYTARTIMADGTAAFTHENGQAYARADLPWAETFDLNIGGARLTTVKQLIPDIGGAVSNVLYSLFYRTSRSLGPTELQTGPRPVRSDGYVDFRTTGRDIRLRLDLAPGGVVQPVWVGQHLVDAVQRGDR